MSLNHGRTEGLTVLCNHYIRRDDFVNAEKYLNMLVHLGSEIAMNKLATLYIENESSDKAIELFLRAISKGYLDSYKHSGDYYKNIGDISNAEKYYLLGASKGHIPSMIQLSEHYMLLNNHKESDKYLEMSADHGDTSSLHKLSSDNWAMYFKTFKDEYYNKMKKYYLMLLHIGDTITKNYINNVIRGIPHDKLIDFYTTFYDFLDDNSRRNFNIIISSVLKAITSDQNFLTKILCMNCKIEKSCIFVKCGHPICCDCYDVIETICGLCGSIEGHKDK